MCMMYYLEKYGNNLNGSRYFSFRWGSTWEAFSQDGIGENSFGCHRRDLTIRFAETSSIEHMYPTLVSSASKLCTQRTRTTMCKVMWDQITEAQRESGENERLTQRLIYLSLLAKRGPWTDFRSVIRNI